MARLPDRRPKQASEQKRSRILVVDNDDAVRLVCTTNLSLDGFDVIEAEDGQTGLERALSDRPDLVLLDVSMPLLDGFELAAALRNDHRTRQVPIVFLSGETGTASAKRANELGALGYLSKPFDPAVVSAFIASVLGVAPAQP